MRYQTLLSTAVMLLGIVLTSVPTTFAHVLEEAGEATEVVAVKVETLADDIDAGTGGIEVDTEGFIYHSDFGWNLSGPGKGGDKVFKISPEGRASVMTTEMNGASGSAIGADGNFYQSCIRGGYVAKISPDGEVSVFVREGISAPVGLIFDKDSNLYVCNCGSSSIQKVTPAGDSTVFCQSDLLQCPNGITMDPDGNFYIANFYNGDVVRIDAEGTAEKLATLPGNNNGHLTYYMGHLYVIARAANQIYRVSLDGEVELFAGSGERGQADGAPEEATFSLPNDLAVSADGRFMYVNEVGPTSGDHRILGPSRIRRIELRREVGENSNSSQSEDAGAETDANAEEDARAQEQGDQSVSIEDLAWITGHWTGEAMGGSFEETWNPPMGGTMAGVFKFVENGEVNFYEILTIVPKDGTLVYRLKHFDKDLNGWEEKDESVEFPLDSVTANEIKFGGLTFTRLSPDRMRIEVVVDQTDAGPQVITFDCVRSAASSAAGTTGLSPEQDAMNAVFGFDELLAAQRDRICESASLATAVRAYVVGLDRIDFGRCPADFAEAYRKHRDAWESAIGFLQKFEAERGEMHQLFGTILSRGDEDSVELERLNKAIVDTWAEVESAAATNGLVR